MRSVTCFATVVGISVLFFSLPGAALAQDDSSPEVKSLIEAARDGDMPAIKAGLARGDDIHEVDKDGMDALMMALLHYEKDIAELLFENGANPNAKDKHGHSALLWAIWRQFVKLAEKLIEAGADVNFRAEDGKTALMYVAAHPHMKDHHHLVHLLMDKGANVDVMDNQGHNAMYLAAMNGHADCVDALVEHNADMDVPMKPRGYTSLHVAAENGHEEVVEHLLRAGAAVTIESNDGHTPLDLAVRNHRRNIVDLIQQAIEYDESAIIDDSGHIRNLNYRQTTDL